MYCTQDDWAACLGPGDIFLSRYGTNYSMLAIGSDAAALCTKHTLIMGGDLLPQFLQQRGLHQTNQVTLDTDGFRQLLSLIERIADSITEHDCGDLVYWALRLVSRTPQQNDWPPVLRQLVNICEQQLRRGAGPVGLVELSQNHHCSPATINRLFKRYLWRNCYRLAKPAAPGPCSRTPALQR